MRLEDLVEMVLFHCYNRSYIPTGTPLWPCGRDPEDQIKPEISIAEGL